MLDVARAADALVVERVSLVPGRDVAVRLQFSAPAIVAAQELGARGGRPDRILVDVDGAVLGGGARGVLAGRGVLVRVIPERRDGGGVRFVFELLEPAGCEIENDDRSATVRITDTLEPRPELPVVPSVRQPGPP
jgi:hypothetical protein